MELQFTRFKTSLLSNRAGWQFSLEVWHSLPQIILDNLMLSPQQFLIGEGYSRRAQIWSSQAILDYPQSTPTATTIQEVTWDFYRPQTMFGAR